MSYFIIKCEGDRLFVRRSRLKAMSNFLIVLGISSLLATIPLISVFVDHYRVLANSMVAGVIYLASSPSLYAVAKYIKKKEFIFDRSSHQMFLNAQPICMLSEITAVWLDHKHVRNGRTPIDWRELYLKLKSGQTIRIELGSPYGAGFHELEDVGRVITEFVGTRTNILRDDELNLGDPEEGYASQSPTVDGYHYRN